MKKSLYILFVITLITLSSCGYIKNNSEHKSMMNDDKSMMSDDKTIGGTYVDYSLEKLSPTKNNVLFFSASWCPTCKNTDKNLKNGSISDNLNILKIDYDSSQDLKKKYGVTTQHTFVQVDKNGNMIKKWTGTMNAIEIEEQINN